jgi:hypothetical protein
MMHERAADGTGGSLRNCYRPWLLQWVAKLPQCLHVFQRFDYCESMNGPFSKILFLIQNYIILAFHLTLHHVI